MRGRELLKMYQNVLDRRPFLVQAVQTGVLMGAGDLISQTIIERQSHVEIKRILKFAGIGVFFCGPVLRVWYGVLNRFIGSTGKTVAIKKVVADQVLFAPTFLSSLLITIGALQGKSWDGIKKEMHSNLPDVLKTNYFVWPWVQLVNFYYVPLQYQVLYVQIVALFWNTYLAWKTNRVHDTPPQPTS